MTPPSQSQSISLQQSVSFCFGFVKDLKFIPTFRTHRASVITIKPTHFRINTPYFTNVALLQLLRLHRLQIFSTYGLHGFHFDRSKLSCSNTLARSHEYESSWYGSPDTKQGDPFRPVADSSFHKLRAPYWPDSASTLKIKQKSVVFFLFDLLWTDGGDLTENSWKQTAQD